jgi:hypothetical protein
MFQLAAVLKALQKHQLKLNCKTDSTWDISSTLKAQVDHNGTITIVELLPCKYVQKDSESQMVAQVLSFLNQDIYIVNRQIYTTILHT